MCKEFGWDYFTYEKQPAIFIDEILVVMNQIAEKDRREKIDAERKSRSKRAGA
jgi:hypothetical protein